ncbi:UNVERIFIED_CONTAM: protein PIGMENT defective, chloroplastic [Sesamum latifolium]|uniref:Protein PIGMENT defective, chloroplastic n=1 Tax=Sesamum latifolium TaxID=2727402 RepID=A0AAW2WJG5_9LAMI
MPIPIHRPCNTNSFFTPSAPFTNPIITAAIFPLAKSPKPRSESCKSLCFSFKLPKFRRTRVPLCAKNGVFEESKDTLLPKRPENEEAEELELLNKPSPKQASNGALEEIEENELKKLDKDEILEPFYKFFRPFEEEIDSEGGNLSSAEEENEKISVEYYEPKPGDLVVGVVVSGNENKLDVNVGADLLGTMLTKEVLPLYDKEMDYLLCDMEKDADEFLVRGKVGIVSNDEAISGEPMPGKPVVEPGTVLFAEVLGRTLGGRPLLSTRRLFRRIAWHRVRQIKQLNEPIEVKITEWNTGGLLTRIEGLRAFLPKAELMNRVNNFTELKENVGRRIHVQITRINEDTNDLILSEKEAWEMMHLQEGTLLEGTVRRIFPYGAQIRIGDTNRSGLLHISNISQSRVTSVSDVLAVDDEVKALVVKSMFPDKISLSIAELESEPGLFLSNKEKVFSEAKEMAKKYRQKISSISTTRKSEALPMDGLPFEDEERLYSNWKWFKFERDSETSP